MTKPDPLRPFKTSSEIVHLAVMLYVCFLLSLRNVDDLLHERGIDEQLGMVRFWWHRFGLMFSGEFRKRRISRTSFSGGRFVVSVLRLISAPPCAR